MKHKKHFNKKALCMAMVMMFTMGVSACKKKEEAVIPEVPQTVAPVEEKVLTQVTGETVMAAVKENMEAVSSMDMDIDLLMGFEVKRGIVKVDADLVGDLNYQATAKPAASHMTGNISMETMKVDNDYDYYTVVEDGMEVIYSDEEGKWTRTVSGPASEQSKITSGFGMTADFSAFTLEDDTITILDHEVYVVKARVSAEKFNGILDILKSKGMSKLLGDVDLSKFGVDYTVYVDTETLLPVVMQLDCTEGFADFFDHATGRVGDMMNMGVTSFVMTTTFNSFDEIEEITVPDTVRLQAVDK